MKLYNGLPIYIVNFDENTEWHNVSIVDYPAIEHNFIQLAEQTELKFAINEEKRDVLGPVLIPNQPIYRKLGGKEFYIEFNAQTIRDLAIKFFGDNMQTEGNVQHQYEVDGVVFYQSFLLDREKGIVPDAFTDLPDGTWFIGAHIENDDVWQLIKEGKLRGFSVDMKAVITPEKDAIDTLEELFEQLNK